MLTLKYALSPKEHSQPTRLEYIHFLLSLLIFPRELSEIREWNVLPQEVVQQSFKNAIPSI